MLSRKKDKQKRNDKPARSHNLAQFGLLDVPDMDNLGIDDQNDDNEVDDDLEAELLALTGGNDESKVKQNRRGKPVVNPAHLDKMVAECMSDEINDDLSDDEDPDLLAELAALTPDEPSPTDSISPTVPAAEVVRERNPEPYTPKTIPAAAGSSVVSILKERLILYERAEANANIMGETSRARRFARGLKTLNQMMKAVNSGQPINEEDIPPEIIVKEATPAVSPVTPVDVDSQPKPPSIVPIPQASLSNVTPAPTPAPSSAPTPAPSSAPTPAPARVAPPIPQIPDPPSNLWDNLPSIDTPQRPIQSCIPDVQETMKTDNTDPIQLLKTRQNQYKMAALQAKKSGNKELAIYNMRTMKQIEMVITGVQAGEQVDMSQLPDPPAGFEIESDTQPSTSSQQPVNASTQQQSSGNEAASNQQEGSSLTPIEALESRLARYTEQRDKAKADGVARKVRMNERIMKQYQDAIRSVSMGRFVDFSELPTPPGFPPIPTGVSAGASASAQPQPTSASGSTSAKTNDEPPIKQIKTTPTPAAVEKPNPPTTKAPAPAPPPVNVRNAPQSRVEKQLAFLTKRQQQFKKAALESKKRGEIEQAKEYLRNAKGFDQLIEASKGGLPVDLNTVPIPPQDQVAPADLDFEVIEAEDCVTAPPKTDADITIIYTKLEEDLINQIKMSAQTREHFKAIGDVASANRFEQLILHTKKDLDAVRAGFKQGRMPPKFHYEMRSFNIIQCNTDLNDNDCEVTVLRGINYNVPNPNEVDTYVKVEFPYPTDYPPQDKGEIVKDTNNPEYNFKSVFSIDRKSRALARLFKRQGVKIEVYAKGGWFSRSSMIGSVKVPLLDLENKCTIHDSYNILDERKKVAGGKLEVRVRLRNPIVTKELKKVTEKWLVIEGF